MPDARRPRRRRLRGWQVAMGVAFAYAALVGAVDSAEVHSERLKIDQGVFTDTFHPLVLTKVLTRPTSATSIGSVPDYPVDVDHSTYRDVVATGSGTLLRDGLVQALVIFLGLWGFVTLLRRQRETDYLGREDEPPFPTTG